MRVGYNLPVRDPLFWVPIRYKLSASYVIICILAFGVGGYLISTSARSAVEKEIMERLQWQSAAHAQALDHGLALLGRRTEDFASDGFIRAEVEGLLQGAPGGGGLKQLEDLERHLAMNKLPLVEAYRNVAIFDPKGILVAAARRGNALPDIERLAPVPAGDRLTFSSLPNPDETGLSFEGSDIGDHLFAIATPLWNLDRSRQLGRLITVVDLEKWLSASLPEATLNAPGADAERMRLTLTDASGEGIEILPGAGSSAGVRVRSVREAEVPNVSREGAERRTGIGRIHGDHFSYGYMIPHSGWLLTIDRNAADALRPVSTLQSHFLGAGLLIVIATIVLLFFPLRFLIRPLTELGTAARRIAAGDFQARAELTSQDEIGDLGNAFNVMAEAVAERTLRLEQTAREIEHRKNDLAIERDRLSAVVHSMKDGLVLLDESGRVEISNEAAGPLLAILDSDGSAVAPRRCAAAGKKSRNCAHCLADPFEPTTSCMIDANDRVFEVLATRLPSARGRSGRVLVARDVTEYVTLDERKVHQERLAVLGEVGAVIAHELNNPLAAISMYAQMMEREMAGDPRWTEHIEVIRRNTEICKRTIRGLLDYAAATPGPEPEDVDVHEMLGDVARFLRPVLEKSGVTIEWELSASATAITCVESHLRHVFVNLILNACQAQTGPGGRIRIRTASPVADESGGSIGVEIEDSGPGIPESLRGRIFEPFFTSKASGKGTGLGLSTARRIIDAIGGRLTLVSGEAGRTVFSVQVPRTAARASWRDLAQIVISAGPSADVAAAEAIS
jgi:signal transduction histidine kinase